MGDEDLPAAMYNALVDGATGRLCDLRCTTCDYLTDDVDDMLEHQEKVHGR